MSARVFALASACLAAGSLLLTGCQSMGTGMFPMQNMSRVPPPGTGTFTPPGNYYNAAPPSGTNTGLQPVNGTLPTTNLTSGSNIVQPAQFTASANSGSTAGATNFPVQQAVYTQPSVSGSGQARSMSGTAVANGLAEGRFQSMGSDEPSGMSDGGVAELPVDPTLQWQP